MATTRWLDWHESDVQNLDSITVVNMIIRPPPPPPRPILRFTLNFQISHRKTFLPFVYCIFGAYYFAPNKPDFLLSAPSHNL